MRKLFAISLFILIFLIFFILLRAFNLRELDDVRPDRACDEELIRKSDVLWAIPFRDSESIANNKTWCEYILSFNKSVQMHGVDHREQEFASIRSEEYLRRGISAFEQCFNRTPVEFKPPYLAWTSENDNLLKDFNLTYRGRIHQITHKVYHCSDSGWFPNWLIDLV